MKTTLPASTLLDVRASLAAAQASLRPPRLSEALRRQPVHTLYGGAHLFRSDTASRVGQVALRALDEYALDGGTLARVLGLEGGLADTVRERVRAKLQREPVEDYRIDFEDGYGHRPPEEEDGHALAAAEQVARGLEQGTLPPFLGLRIKPLTEELAERALRTLDLFLTALVERTGGRLPEGFVVTLPKVLLPEQVAALEQVLEGLELRLGLAQGALGVELMVEAPQALVDAQGRVALPGLVAAARGRCTGAHFGAYDYTAALEVAAAHQRLLHPACDFARHLMQVSLAGTGVALADGATTLLPVAPHRASPGERLTPTQQEENRATVHRAWRLHAEHVRRALEQGLYQGWDLHPAQLPARYAVLYAFFLEEREAATRRLRAFLEQAAQATRLGDIFDDAATGQGLLNFFLRGLACGALTEEEVHAAGLTPEELRSRSFLRILEGRRKR